MIITCTDSSGFEDIITTGKDYKALEVKGASFLIKDDNGNEKWLGGLKFKVSGVSL